METVTGGVNCHYQTACLPCSGKARGFHVRPYLKSVRIGTARCARCQYHFRCAQSFAAAAFLPRRAIREKQNEEIAIYGHVVTTTADRRVLHHPSSRSCGTPGTSGRSRRGRSGQRSRQGSRSRQRSRPRGRPSGRGPIMPGGTASFHRPRRTRELRQRLNI
jgi:hypothetical protein